MGFNIERADKPFVVKSPYKPSGDQPQAIAELAERVENGENDVVLMGATGTGKTATTAWLIEKLQRPTLIIEPNKTLAAQLCAEFRERLAAVARNGQAAARGVEQSSGLFHDGAIFLPHITQWLP